MYNEKQLLGLFMGGQNKTGGPHMLGRSDWRIAGDDEVGLSGGELVKVGGDYVHSFEVARISNEAVHFKLRGGAVEVGVGIGVEEKGLVDAFKLIGKLLKYASHFKIGLAPLPSGGFGALHYGLFRAHDLARTDFNASNWIYVSGGFMSAMIGADVGMIFLLNQSWDTVKARLLSIVGSSGMAAEILCNTIAFGGLGGFSWGVGVEAGVSIKEMLLYVVD